MVGNAQERTCGEMVVFTEVLSSRLLWKVFGGSEQRPPYRLGKLVWY